MSIDYTILNELEKRLPSRMGIPFNAIILLISDLYKLGTIRNSITGLKKKDYITFKGRHMEITTKGKTYLKERSVLLQNFKSPFSQQEKRRLIVIFDIPENRKAEREWFRYHLRKFNYKMIQRSVWFGPSPLPNDFVMYIKTIGLQDSIKIFTAQPSDL